MRVFNVTFNYTTEYPDRYVFALVAANSELEVKGVIMDAISGTEWGGLYGVRGIDKITQSEMLQTTDKVTEPCIIELY